MVQYKLSVTTGDRRGAGTNAVVHVTIYGKNGDSGVRNLEGKSLFQRGKTDEFSIEAVDLGEISKIRIGHDGKGIGASWFLDKAVVTLPDGTQYFFLCGRWLSKDEDDGQIEREIPATNKDGVASLPSTYYKVTVVTGGKKKFLEDSNCV